MRKRHTAPCGLCGAMRVVNESRSTHLCGACRMAAVHEGPGDWTEHAECRNHDPELFWPEKNDEIKPAQQICLTCPVQAQCLDYAVKTKQTQGIWGGLTPAARIAWARMQEAS